MDEKNRTYVENMIQGDESAFDELYHIFSGKLYRMDYFITGNKSDSEDVLQETFVKCFLHRKSLQDPEAFESWIYRILVRTAWKISRKRKELSLDSMLENPDETGFGQWVGRELGDGPLDQLLKKEADLEIWQLVGSMNVKYKTVILLYYYNGLGTREIAKITGTLEGTVKSRLFTARKLLRKQLEQKEGGLQYEEKLG